MWIVANAVTLGLINISDSYREFAYGGMKKIATGNDDLVGGRTTGFALGLLLAIGTVGIHPLYRKVMGQTFDDTWDPALNGKAERKMYYAIDADRDALAKKLQSEGSSQTVEQLKQSDPAAYTRRIDEMHRNRKADTVKAMGYDPEDKKSIFDFLGTEEGQEKEGDSQRIHVIRDEMREGISAFQYIRIEIIIRASITNAHSINFFNEKTKKAVADPAEADRFINMYLACQTEHSEGLDKEAQKLAIADVKSKGHDPDDKNNPIIKALIEKLTKKHRAVLEKKHYTYDPRQGSWRMASDDVNDPDEGRSVRGEFSKKTQELIDAIYNKSLTKNKMDLRGERSKKKDAIEDDNRAAELENFADRLPPRLVM